VGKLGLSGDMRRILKTPINYLVESGTAHEKIT
jgi:hypothetical protein